MKAANSTDNWHDMSQTEPEIYQLLTKTSERLRDYVIAIYEYDKQVD